MSHEIMINVGPRETRAVLLENGALMEVWVERGSRRGLVGNVYKGRVQRVLPGMQAAFVEVGLTRTAFLHVDDIAASVPPEHAAREERVEDIRRLVSAGDEIIVQVVKDPIGSKGARLTTFLSLPSRYLVFMPRANGVGVSARITDEAERERLRTAVTARLAAGHNGGYIVRTAAEGVSTEALDADIDYLDRLWSRLTAAIPAACSGEVLHSEPSLGLRMLRDECARGVEQVLVDDAEECERMREFARAFMPSALERIELYTQARPLFDLHQVEEEIKRALERQVNLKSGGHLVIEQTESMTTIDVNTGAYVGHRTLEDTIFRTNLEAAVAIARQLRLRNLGGIIIIDFIDMQTDGHRQQVLDALTNALAPDRAHCRITGLSPLGLVEMSRKRTRDSLAHQLCEPCRSCEGRGYQRTAETVCQDIFREILRQGRQFPSRELLILAHSDVLERLLEEDSAVIAELESQIGRPIRLQVEALYAVDQFDVVLN
jgi:ribonuclease G